MPSCLAFGCSNKSSNKGQKNFKIPDPKKDLTLCSHCLHNIGNAKWTVNNLDGPARRNERR